ncbi:MAG: FtsX-like permease family protein [Pseudomonadota bacterium]
MSPLDRKLARDLWNARGQGLSISLVVACGVTLLVMMSGLVSSLDATRAAYYDRYRLADVFAPVKRAPRALLDELEALPGVTTAVGRVSGGALIDLPEQSAPIRAQAVSLPDFGRAALNEIHLTRGRRPNAARPQEIVLLAGFAAAHAISPGAELAATMQGVQQQFVVVGLAEAPEFLTTLAPGEMAPDDARFAVLWLSETALEAAFDMEGAFNEALLKLDPGIATAAVIDGADRILERSGSLGAYGLEDHLSDRFVTEEIKGLRASTNIVPPVFVAVAAFLLYIVMARMIQNEREQIGLLKSFGYSDLEVGWHYTKFVLVIASVGTLLGCGFGFLAGRAMANLYQQYFKFPFLVFQIPPAVLGIGLCSSLLAAAAGGLLVVRRVFALSPAVAMRPPAPPSYTKSGRWLKSLLKAFDQPSRMVLRQLLRQPGRTALAITGIAVGMALSVAMLAIMTSFQESIDQSFTMMDRSDMSVVFVEPRDLTVVHELRRLRGVLEAEPVRAVPVIFRNGTLSYRGSINGYRAEPALQRALDEDLDPIFIRGEGLLLSKPLAARLEVSAGDTVQVDVREGRRPTLELPVLAVTKSLVGAPAYYEIGALNRALKEDRRTSAVYLTIDTQESDQLYEAIKNMPTVAGVTLKQDARESLERMMNEGAGGVRYVMAFIAGLITFGIVYNSARIAFAERSRDLSSLRVFGFTSGETAYVLLGELIVLSLLALPLGMLLGHYFAIAVAEGFSTDLYQIPAEVPVTAHAGATLAVLLATFCSAALVKRDLDRLDFVQALKSRD